MNLTQRAWNLLIVLAIVAFLFGLAFQTPEQEVRSHGTHRAADR